MLNLKEEHWVYRPGPAELRDMLAFVWRYRTHPDALEPFLDALKERHPNVPEVNVANVRSMMMALRKSYLDKTASYRLDMYLTAGMGAIDLVLLPVLLPIGVQDRLLYIAVTCLAVSLVLVAASLLVSFVKRDLHIDVYGYGKAHAVIISSALLSGTTALTATFLNVDRGIGIVFLVLVVLAYVGCIAYALLARTLLIFIHGLTTSSESAQPVSREQDDIESSGASRGDIRSK